MAADWGGMADKPIRQDEDKPPSDAEALAPVYERSKIRGRAMADPAPQPKAEPASDHEAGEAHALAPVYDYIRCLVARWEAEQRSCGEDKSA
jgi:hypothetical protein